MFTFIRELWNSLFKPKKPKNRPRYNKVVQKNIVSGGDIAGRDIVVISCNKKIIKIIEEPLIHPE